MTSAARCPHRGRAAVGVQLRSGLWTPPRLTRAWTALRRCPLRTAVHTPLDAGKRTPAAHKPLGKPAQRTAGFPQRPQAPFALGPQPV